LRNVPKSEVVVVDVQASGTVAVALVSAADYRTFPAVVRPLFHGLIEHRLSFSVTLAAGGDYFLVFDNRSAGEPRAITVMVRGTHGKQWGTTQQTLAEFERRLHQLFIFDPFPIRAELCGKPIAFNGPSGIVLCEEYARKLYDTLADQAKAGDAILFTLFHELGHILLAQWKFPFFDNEEVADEFATVLMVMLDQRERVRANAEYFAANPSVAEAIAKTFRDDRHLLSAQRALNIVRWLNDPQLLRKWQTIFVPHMQTAVLERLLRQRTAWTDRALVEKELAARR
jgi:Putative metallopeptidase